MAKSPEERRASAKRSRLMLLYRITPEEQDAVEEFQRKSWSNYGVLLTKGDPNETALLFNDHNHVTGAYRGRLAYLINKALGVLEGAYKERTPEILTALSYYLRFPPAPMAIGIRYGLIGRAKKKKKMIYGSPDGPITAPKKGKK